MERSEICAVSSEPFDRDSLVSVSEAHCRSYCAHLEAIEQKSSPESTWARVPELASHCFN